jgi:hypothetical protein
VLLVEGSDFLDVLLGLLIVFLVLCPGVFLWIFGIRLLLLASKALKIYIREHTYYEKEQE